MKRPFKDKRPVGPFVQTSSSTDDSLKLTQAFEVSGSARELEMERSIQTSDELNQFEFNIHNVSVGMTGNYVEVTTHLSPLIDHEGERTLSKAIEGGLSDAGLTVRPKGSQAKPKRKSWQIR